MPTLATVSASNAAYNPPYTAVAVFVGGTHGVGEATVKALASHTGGNVHIYIVGRNKAAAEKILTTLPRGSPELQREFVFCDALVMANIASSCAVLSEKLSSAGLDRINHLVLSHGWIKLSGRKETVDGLDDMLAIRFYSRVKFIRELLHFLERAKAAGQQAAMLSILGSKSSPPLALDDLELKKAYGALKAAGASGAYSDILFDGFAKRHPGIAFTHIFPGFVDTGATNAVFSYWPAYALWPLIKLATFFLSITPEEASEYMLYALLQSQNGWVRMDNKAENVGPIPYTTEEKEAVWEHAMKVTN
ncbi:NAD(P)-binding protein [Cylindrobasidium torrendii FP15055 ss-10]|uniref:NAD(P)-binding protein n=1 Tax=Cylindrobasidium torrendii FP15055 ss-10 TaxID=1314674 RepID=A0A0D7B1G5_9AGAR|nr:NAD(P)-binding protein [Cylindrobasidium torrendii FP15055 ss-10]